MILPRFSPLSSTLKAFTSNNVSVKIAALTLSHISSHIQLRSINVHYPMLKSVEERLGLEKPKRPLYPFFRFMKEFRQTFNAKNPKTKQSEITSLAAEKWKTIDATIKEKFEREYKREILNYSIACANYRKKLSDDDIRNIKEMKETIKEKKAMKEIRRESGQPKRPLNNFQRYLKTQTDRYPNEEHRKFLKRVAIRWQNLTESEKEVYKTPVEDVENYKKALLQWKEKIRESVHHDEVSDEIIVSSGSKTLPSHKYSSK